jgi:hypothetical protein
MLMLPKNNQTFFIRHTEYDCLIAQGAAHVPARGRIALFLGTGIAARLLRRSRQRGGPQPSKMSKVQPADG